MSKITYENVKADIESQGWKLLSTEYKNLKADLEVQCPEGHLCYVSYEKWRRGNYQCPTCKQNPFFQVNQAPPKKNGFRVLGIDQASGTSGFAVYDDENLVSYGAHTSEGSHNTIKIANTKYWMASLIDKWKPDLIVLEDIQLQSYMKSENERADAVVMYKKLAHLQGVLKNYIYELGLPYKIVAPATWRNFSAVKGKSRTDRKRSAQLRVKALFDVSVSQDEADAVLIARWGAHNHTINKIISFE